jgi:hypothetical protein
MRSTFCSAMLLAAMFAPTAYAEEPGTFPTCEGAAPVSGAADLAAAFQADRVYVQIGLRNKQAPLCFYTDSGGGLVLSEAGAVRMDAKPARATDPEIVAEVGPNAQIVGGSVFNGTTHAPGLSASDIFVVVPEVRQTKVFPLQGDGILGQSWFAGRVWTWDYPAGRLTLHTARWTPPHGTPWPVHFKTGTNGAHETDFPRVEMTVDGQTISMLLDTGAETYLTVEAEAQLNDAGPRFRATSMITKTVFDGWRAHHPDWRVIENAQVATHAAMIEVPEVVIAGHRVAKVWFTARPDANFRQVMSSMMDATVDGSIGGNALHGLKVTVDYPAGRAWIE